MVYRISYLFLSTHVLSTVICSEKLLLAKGEMKTLLVGLICFPHIAQNTFYFPLI